MIKKIFYSFLCVATLITPLKAEFIDNLETVCGKVEVGPTVLRVDLMDCGKRDKKMDLYGYRADACWVVTDGWCLKPTMLMAWGDGDLYTLSLAFGRCIPLCNEKIIITPSVGYSWSYLSTENTITIPTEFGPYEVEGVKQKFSGTAPFLGLDVLFNLTPCWRICGSFQYGFSRSWSKLSKEGVFTHRCHTNSKGPSYGLMIERDINKKFSVNLGIGYNHAYSSDKSGLKAKGAKLGIVYWF